MCNIDYYSISGAENYRIALYVEPAGPPTTRVYTRLEKATYEFGEIEFKEVEDLSAETLLELIRIEERYTVCSEIH